MTREMYEEEVAKLEKKHQELVGKYQQQVLDKQQKMKEETVDKLESEFDQVSKEKHQQLEKAFGDLDALSVNVVKTCLSSLTVSVKEREEAIAHYGEVAGTQVKTKLTEYQNDIEKMAQDIEREVIDGNFRQMMEHKKLEQSYRLHLHVSLLDTESEMNKTVTKLHQYLAKIEAEAESSIAYLNALTLASTSYQRLQIEAAKTEAEFRNKLQEVQQKTQKARELYSSAEVHLLTSTAVSNLEKTKAASDKLSALYEVLRGHMAKFKGMDEKDNISVSHSIDGDFVSSTDSYRQKYIRMVHDNNRRHQQLLEDKKRENFEKIAEQKTRLEKVTKDLHTLVSYFFLRSSSAIKYLYVKKLTFQIFYSLPH